MKTNLYTLFFNNAQKLKRALGIDNFEAFKKKNKRKFLRLIYRKKYNVEDLIRVMKKMGLQKGSIIFIHSSMTEFYNFDGDAKDLIEQLMLVIGEEGTLMMPAYPKLNEKVNGVDLDIINSKSGAGYLSEIFRKMPNVKRSINLQHSVCAWGKLAEEFTKDHHKSITTWDKFSPYYKMSLKDTLVFSFGLPFFLGTIIHCTESILCDKYEYFTLFFNSEKTYSFIDKDGKLGTHTYKTHNFARKRSKKKIIVKYFDKSEFNRAKLSNLNIEMVNAKYTLNLFLNLAENGITMYSNPNPSSYRTAEGRFIKRNLD